MNTYSAFYSDRPRVGGVLSHSQTEGREEGGSRAQEGREVGGFGRKIVVVEQNQQNFFAPYGRK